MSICEITYKTCFACDTLLVAWSPKRAITPELNLQMADPRALEGTMDIVADTVGEITFRKIRGDIIAGTLQPGQKLKLEQLKSKYAVSVSTLREILNRLTTEDLVVAEGQRGFQVSPATKANLREMGDLRLVLENHALEMSFAMGDLDWEAQVVAAHHKLSSIEKAL